MAKDESKKLKLEIEELDNKWKRALADYQNLEKRSEQAKEDFVKFANGQLILKILPALDSLKMAEAHLGDEGLKLAVKQLRDALAGEGVEKIETVDREFDPMTMECVEVVAGPQNRVVEELRAGYTVKGRVLRVAQVKVGQEKE